MKLSYLNLRTTDPAWNLAAEQYVFEHLPKDRTYFMLWQNDNAIIIGKHQNTLAEINESYVRANNIRVVRRLSGGGAVYHDLGNLNFTFIADATNKESINFKLFCQPIVQTLAKLGVQAEISGRNDITIDGKKFSGNSQRIKDGRVMHHGTILFNSDLSVVSQALQVDTQKIQAKGIKSVRSRVTNISEYIPNGTDLETFRMLLLDHILQEESAEEYIFNDNDMIAIDSIANQRYRTWDWNFGHSPECAIHKKQRFEGCGTVEAFIAVERGFISDIKFAGDFFSIKEPEGLSALLIGIKPDVEDYNSVINKIQISEYFVGLKNQDFLDFLK